MALGLSAAAVLGIALASCLGLHGGRGSTFPHEVHVDGMNLACTFCHVTVRTADLPSMPPPELCAPCHDELDRGLPEDRRVASLFGPGGRFQRSAPKPLAPDVKFTHRVHVGGAKLECTQCHSGVMTSDRISTERLDWKTHCMACHEQRGQDNRKCATCHEVMDRDHPPPSHVPTWDARHGDVVRSHDDAPQHRCELCHDQKDSCRACHQSTPPRSHDNFFRLRGHGIMAAIDRSRCETCHRTDTCQQCHAETRPLSHRGGFGDPQQRHCNNCHFPLGDNGCVVCHKGTPSHQQATPMPPDHSPAMNCRLCHGNGQPLPHPDGGHPCTVCHK